MPISLASSTVVFRSSRTKKLALGLLVAAAVFLGLEFGLWVVGVDPAWLDEDPFAGFSRHLPHYVSETGPDGQVYLTVSPTKSRVLNPQRFLAKKPEGVYRIFCVGGSTTYGRPFYDGTSYPGWLRAFLSEAQPSRRWEVINAGAISYASYRDLGLVEELADYSPDLFVVYTGHNEFLERRTYAGLAELPPFVTGVLSVVSWARTPTVIRRGFDFLGVPRRPSSHRTSQLGEHTKAIPLDAVGPEAYHRDEAMARDVTRHFTASLERMIRVARRAHADIVFVVPASNLAAFAPIKSQHLEGLGDADLAQWTALENRARSLAAGGDREGALRLIGEAKRIDDRFAGLFYFEGQVLQELGRFDLARQAFLRARDEDICPLRASSAVVGAVRRVAESHGGCCVDFESLAVLQSEHGLPGNQMFHDHVHLTVEANRTLALALVDYLRDRRILRPSSSWGEAAIRNVTTRVEAAVDRPAHAHQLRLLASMLGWLQQPVPAHYQAELSLGLSGRTLAALSDLAEGFRLNGAPALATEYFTEAATLYPTSAQAHYGVALSWLDRGDQVRAIPALRTAIDLDPGLNEARVRLGLALASRDELAESEQQFAEVARRVPDSAASHCNLGLILARQGKHSEAEAAYRRALALDSESPTVHDNLALLLEELGRISEAREHYQAVLRANPAHVHALSRLRILTETR